MAIDRNEKKKLQENLKKELEQLGKRQLSESEAWDAYHNLAGFFKTLKKMKKEAQYASI